MHVARGRIRVNGATLKTVDGIKVAREAEVKLDQGEDAEILVFDLP